VLRQAWERTGMRLVSYIAMPNHWHLVAWPEHDGQLSEWAQVKKGVRLDYRCRFPRPRVA